MWVLHLCSLSRLFCLESSESFIVKQMLAAEFFVGAFQQVETFLCHSPFIQSCYETCKLSDDSVVSRCQWWLKLCVSLLLKVTAFTSLRWSVLRGFFSRCINEWQINHMCYFKKHWAYMNVHPYPCLYTNQLKFILLISERWLSSLRSSISSLSL